MLTTRLFAGLAFGLLLLGVTWVGGWFFTAFMYLLAWYSNRELHAMLAARGTHLSLPIMQLTSALSFVSWQWLTGYSHPGTLGKIASFSFSQGAHLALLLAFLILLFSLLFRHPDQERPSMADLGAAAWVVFYTGWLPAHWIGLRNLHDGFRLMVLTASCVIAVDTGAYFAGKSFGRRPFFLSISPKKTVEGALGGLLVPLPLAAGLAWWFGQDIPRALLLILLVSVSAQFGDLIESMFKRDAGIKDSGDTVPGHGGLLDRADSFIFSGAVAYYFTLLLGFSRP